MLAKIKGSFYLSDGHKLVKVNRTAAYVFNLLDGCTTKKEIIAQILKDFDVDERRAIKDLEQTISSFKALGILVD